MCRSNAPGRGPGSRVVSACCNRWASRCRLDSIGKLICEACEPDSKLEHPPPETDVAPAERARVHDRAGYRAKWPYIAISKLQGAMQLRHSNTKLSAYRKLRRTSSVATFVFRFGWAVRLLHAQKSTSVSAVAARVATRGSQRFESTIPLETPAVSRLACVTGTAQAAENEFSITVRTCVFY